MFCLKERKKIYGKKLISESPGWGAHRVLLHPRLRMLYHWQPCATDIANFVAAVIFWFQCDKVYETERSSGCQLWYSLETLKTSFKASTEYQGCHPDDLSVFYCLKRLVHSLTSFKSPGARRIAVRFSSASRSAMIVSRQGIRSRCGAFNIQLLEIPSFEESRDFTLKRPVTHGNIPVWVCSLYKITSIWSDGSWVERRSSR